MARNRSNILKQDAHLGLDRCPHCGVAKPNMEQAQREFITERLAGAMQRLWVVYGCATCGGCVLTYSRLPNEARPPVVVEMYPDVRQISEAIPTRAHEYLEQTMASVHAPAGAVMLAASAIDAMLKAKDYRDGTLNSRIEKAKEDHLITDEMAEWAHDVRLDANDQRHADENATLPDEQDARSSLEFALALAEFLFVLPDRVKRGREGSGDS